MSFSTVFYDYCFCVVTKRTYIIENYTPHQMFHQDDFSQNEFTFSFDFRSPVFFNYVFLLKILRFIITVPSHNSFSIQGLFYNGNKFAFENFLVLLQSKVTLQFSLRDVIMIRPFLCFFISEHERRARIGKIISFTIVG